MGSLGLVGDDDSFLGYASNFGGPNDTDEQERWARMGHPENAYRGYWGYDIGSDSADGVAVKRSWFERNIGDPDDPEIAAKARSMDYRMAVTNPTTGVTVTKPIVDIGPVEGSRADIDLLPTTERELQATGMTEVSYRLASGADDQTTQYQPDQPEIRVQKSPIDTIKSQYAGFENSSDEEIVNKLGEIFPEVDREKLETFARDPNGMDAIAASIRGRRSPIQDLREEFPQFKGVSDDAMLHGIYDQFIDPKKLSFDAFSAKFTRKSPEQIDKENSAEMSRGILGEIGAAGIELGRQVVLQGGINALKAGRDTQRQVYNDALSNVNDTFNTLYGTQGQDGIKGHLDEWLKLSPEDRQDRIDKEFNAKAEALRKSSPGGAFVNGLPNKARQQASQLEGHKYKFLQDLAVVQNYAKTEKSIAWMTDAIGKLDDNDRSLVNNATEEAILKMIGGLPSFALMDIAPGLRETGLYAWLHDNARELVDKTYPDESEITKEDKANQIAQSQFPAQEAMALIFLNGGNVLSKAISNRTLRAVTSTTLTAGSGAVIGGGQQIINNVATKKDITDGVGEASGLGALQAVTGKTMFAGGRLIFRNLFNWLAFSQDGKRASALARKMVEAPLEDLNKFMAGDPDNSITKGVEERAAGVVNSVLKKHAGNNSAAMEAVTESEIHLENGDTKEAIKATERGFSLLKGHVVKKKVGDELQSTLTNLSDSNDNKDNEATKDYLYGRDGNESREANRPAPVGPEQPPAPELSEPGSSASPQEEYGHVGGSPASAASFLRGDGGAGGGAVPARQVPGGGRRNLVDWAKGIGRLIDSKLLFNAHGFAPLNRRGGVELQPGQEHLPFFHPFRSGWTLKLYPKNKNNIKDQLAYLDRMTLSERAFPGLKWGMVGVIDGKPNGDDGVTIVTEMPFFKAVKDARGNPVEPTPGEIKDWYEKGGWVQNKENHYAFYHPGFQIEAYDNHGGNLIKLEDGNLVPIDVMLRDVATSKGHRQYLDTFRPENYGLPPEAKLAPDVAAAFQKPLPPEEYIQRRGPVTIARDVGIAGEDFVKYLSTADLRRDLDLYRLAGKDEKGDIILKELIRRRKGESGSIPNPAQLIIDGVTGLSRGLREIFDASVKARNALLKSFMLEGLGDVMRKEFKPRTLTEGADRAAMYIIKYRNAAKVRAAQFANQVYRHMLAGNILRGGEDSEKRYDYFQKYDRSQREEFVMRIEEGRPTGNKVIDYMGAVAKQIMKGMAAEDAKMGLKYDMRDNYLMHLLEPTERERFIADVTRQYHFPDPKFMSPREFDTYRQALLARDPKTGKPMYKMKAANLEQIVQLRIADSMGAYGKINLLKALAKDGYAWETNIMQPGKNIPRNVPSAVKQWTKEVHTADGKHYLIEDGAWQIIHHAYDKSRLDGSSWGKAVSFFQTLKGVSSPIHLGTTLGHEDHLLRVRLSDRLVNLTRNPKRTAKDFLLAFIDANPALPGVLGAFRDYQAYGNIIDILRGKRDPQTPREYWDHKNLIDAGFTAELSHEREIELPFTAWAEKTVKAWMNKNPGSRQSIAFGYSLLTNRFVNRWMFRELIPSIKAASLIEKINNLARDRPELWTKGHELERLNELQKLNHQVDVREGELNFDNIFWEKMWKDTGIASMQSLGWNIGLFDYSTGWAVDTAHSLSHMDEIIDTFQKKGAGSAFRKAISDRMMYTTYMTAVTMMRGAFITYIMGQVGKKGLEWLDYFYPRIGVNKNYTEKRLKPLDFPTEMTALYEHWKREGIVKGTETIFTNKSNPVISAFLESVQNVNYYGNKIRGPEESSWKNVEYFFSHAFGPIAGEVMAKPIQDVFHGKNPVGDILPAVMGYMGLNDAPHWTSRTDLQNRIIQKHSEQYGQQHSETDSMYQAIHAFQQAKDDGDVEALADAHENLLKLGKTEKQIKAIYDSANIPIDVKFFKTLNVKNQIDIWKSMTPEEKAQYAPFVKKDTIKQLESEQ